MKLTARILEAAIQAVKDYRISPTATETMNSMFELGNRIQGFQVVNDRQGKPAAICIYADCQLSEAEIQELLETLRGE